VIFHKRARGRVRDGGMIAGLTGGLAPRDRGEGRQAGLGRWVRMLHQGQEKHAEVLGQGARGARGGARAGRAAAQGEAPTAGGGVGCGLAGVAAEEAGVKVTGGRQMTK